MFFRTLRDLARPQIVAIFDVLKRSDGLAVGDIAEALKMSYMGVKQYCIELEKRGYLDTWRRAKETGRPELTYRLTAKAQVLFPQHSNELSLEILDAVRQLHGPTAAEKILYQYFLKKTDAYSKKIKGKSLVERATSLAKLRDAEAHCAQVDYDPRHGLRLTEFHSPLADLIKAYPSVAKMEESMLSRLLQAPVQREMTAVSGLMRITFLVAGATLPPPAPPATTVRTRVVAKRPDKAALTAGAAASGEPALGELVPCGPTVDEVHAAEETPAEPVVAVTASTTECALPPVQPPEADAAPVTAGTVDWLGTAPSSTPAAPPPAGGALAPATSPAEEATDPAPRSGDDREATVSASEPAALAPPVVDTPSTPSVAPHPSVDAVDEEPLLFAPPTQPATPRLPTRTVAPARTAAKSADPVAEELFLSL